MRPFVFVGFLLVYLHGFAQRPIAESELPRVIAEGFELAYPDLPPHTWEQRNTRFVAIIRHEDRTEFATFLETGEWAETRHNVERAELPEKMLSLIDTRYNAYRIQSLEYVEENGGGIYYAALLALRSNPNITTELFFDMGGNILMIDGLHVDEYSGDAIVVGDNVERRLRPGNQREVIDIHRGVPDIVVQNLTRRYGVVSTIEWTITDLGFHRADYRFRDANIATEWDDEGNQVSVITFFNRRNAAHLIQRFLDENFPRSRFISGERVVYETRFTRMFPERGLRSFFVIEISDQPRGTRRPTFYTVYFDASGQLDMIIERNEENE